MIGQSPKKNNCFLLKAQTTLMFWLAMQQNL